MGLAMEKIKSVAGVYVDFIEDWPGAVAILWPATVVLAIWVL